MIMQLQAEDNTAALHIIIYVGMVMVDAATCCGTIRAAFCVCLGPLGNLSFSSSNKPFLSATSFLSTVADTNLITVMKGTK